MIRGSRKKGNSQSVSTSLAIYQVLGDAGPAVDVLAVLLLPLASLASLIPLSALCELTPLSIPPDSNELAESADVDSDVYV